MLTDFFRFTRRIELSAVGVQYIQGVQNDSQHCELSIVAAVFYQSESISEEIIRNI